MSHVSLARAFYLLPGLRVLERGKNRESVQRVLSGLDLPSSVLNEPSTILPTKDVIAAYHRTACILNSRDIGTQAARLIGIKDQGLLGRYTIEASNLGAALNRLQAALPSQASGIELALVAAEESLVLKQQAKPCLLNGWHHICNMLACQYIDLVRHFAGADWKPTHVTVDYSAQLKSHDFEDFVACPVEYDCDAMSVAFPPRLLQLQNRRRPKSGDRTKFSDVERLRQREIPRRRLGIVKELIQLRLKIGKSDRYGLAEKMGISEGTLQRVISREGTTYDKLVAQAQFERASVLLDQRRLSIGEIAENLGYARAGHFPRAFKR